MANKPKDKLIETVLHNSHADTWEEARKKWIDTAFESINEESKGLCSCGQHNLKYLYAIKHKDGHWLRYIGSTCIGYFDNDYLNSSLAQAQKEAEAKSKELELMQGVEWEEPKEILTKKLLQEWDKKGYFKKTKENQFDSNKDFLIFDKSLNGRNWESFSVERKKYLKKVLDDYIIPQINGTFDEEAYQQKLTQELAEQQEREREALRIAMEEAQKKERIKQEERERAQEEANKLALKIRLAEQERQQKFKAVQEARSKRELLAEEFSVNHDIPVPSFMGETSTSRHFGIVSLPEFQDILKLEQEAIARGDIKPENEINDLFDLGMYFKWHLSVGRGIFHNTTYIDRKFLKIMRHAQVMTDSEADFMMIELIKINRTGAEQEKIDKIYDRMLAYVKHL